MSNNAEQYHDAIEFGDEEESSFNYGPAQEEPAEEMRHINIVIHCAPENKSSS